MEKRTERKALEAVTSASAKRKGVNLIHLEGGALHLLFWRQEDGKLR